MKLQCMQCGQPMQQVAKKTHKGVRTTYRIRKFRCDLCDYEETIHADGYRDLKVEPYMAKKEIDQMYDQQSKFNEL